MSNTLLYLSFSPRHDSVSTGLADEFLTRWQRANEGAQIIRQDLGLAPTEGPDDSWIKANMTPERERTPDQAQRLAFSDEAIANLHWASHVLLATPMFNFTIPWSLKSYIDQIVRVEKTFSFDPAKGAGPLLDAKKKLLLIWASAFDYPAGTQAEASDYLTPYLKHVFGFMGITQIESISAGNQWGSPEAVTASLGNAREQLGGLTSRW